MIAPLQPLFLIQVLRVKQMQILGFIQTLVSISSLAIRPISGNLSDRKGRKGFILSGFSLNILSRLTQALVTSWIHLVPVKILNAIGVGTYYPTMTALFAESVDKNQFGKAFGRLESMQRFGAMIGPLIGWGLLGYFLKNFSQDISYRLVFFLAAVPSLVGLILVYLGVHDTVPIETETNIKRPVRLPLSGMGKKIILFTIICGLFEFWATSETFILVRVSMVGKGLFQQASMAIIIYWLINMAGALAAFLSGGLSDRVGRKIPLVLSMVLLSLFSLAFTFSDNLVSIGILSCVFGLYQGFLKPARTALVVDLAPEGMKAEILGSFSMYLGLFAFPGPLVFGFLWDNFDWRTPFIVSGIAEIICALLLAILYKEN